MRKLSHAEFIRLARRPAARRGRRKNADWKSACERDATYISFQLRQSPISQPIDPQFSPYYQRVLDDGRLAPILEYCRSRHWIDLGPSFYEFLGRLVPLQSVDAVKKILSDVTRRALSLAGYHRLYKHLLPLCNEARQFIEEKYKAAAQTTHARLDQHYGRAGALRADRAIESGAPDERELRSWAEAEVAVVIKREQLWREYVDRFFHEKEGEGERSQNIKELLAYADAESADLFSLDVVSRLMFMSMFNSHHIVSKQMFFDLEAGQKTASDRAERDRRYRPRNFLTTPSDIARKYAAAMTGISPSTASHN